MLSFIKLKEAPVIAPTLATLDSSKEAIVTCSAFMYAVSAVLEQKHWSRFCSIAYATRTLNSAKQNYAVLEKERLAVVETVRT